MTEMTTSFPSQTLRSVLYICVMLEVRFCGSAARTCSATVPSVTPHANATVATIASLLMCPPYPETQQLHHIAFAAQRRRSGAGNRRRSRLLPVPCIAMLGPGAVGNRSLILAHELQPFHDNDVHL